MLILIPRLADCCVTWLLGFAMVSLSSTQQSFRHAEKFPVDR
jgi:hypothetical protein